MLLRSRPRRIALWLGLVAAFFSVDAQAADTSAGSKNFAAPASVPNYFSNEAGPLRGPASETQRGPLYMNQTYGTPQPPARPVAVVVPHGRQHIAMAEPRGRSIRGRVTSNRHGRVASDRHGRATSDTRGRTLVAAHHPAAHERLVHRAVAHVAARGHAEHAVARAHAAVHKPTSVNAAHRHARG
jgi:hypothetical protein